MSAIELAVEVVGWAGARLHRIVPVLLVTLASCTTAPATRPATSVDLLSAQEALFRHQIVRIAPLGSEYTTVCISTQGFRPQSDPAPELVARLHDVAPPVKPWSACRWSDARPLDAATGRPAVQVAQSLQCIDADHCKGSGGYAYGNLGANFFDYALTRQSGRWAVGELMTGIS
jgi:hypothetical protein